MGRSDSWHRYPKHLDTTLPVVLVASAMDAGSHGENGTGCLSKVVPVFRTVR